MLGGMCINKHVSNSVHSILYIIYMCVCVYILFGIYIKYTCVSVNYASISVHNYLYTMNVYFHIYMYIMDDNKEVIIYIKQIKLSLSFYY